MKTKFMASPRFFNADKKGKIKISDCGKIWLDADEQVSFVTKSGREYDVAAKTWGFYATPSINSRLKKEGFKTALVKNKKGRYYVMIIEDDKLEDFYSYIKQEESSVEKWLSESRSDND